MFPTRRYSIPILAGMLLSTAFAGRAAADTVVLQPLKDNTIYGDATSNSNGAGDGVFAGLNRLGGVRRGLMAFDLTGVPSGSTINSVTLRLQVSSSHPVPSLVGLHKLNADWGEAGSFGGGAGAPAQVGDATWLRRFFNTLSWASPGGDFVASPSASQTVTNNGPYTWSGAGLVADVQSWVDSPAGNFGWLLRGTEDLTQSAKKFDSREGFVKPTLTVDYTPEEVDVPEQGAWSLSLAPPAPNPSRGEVSFIFTVPVLADVRLDVIDTAGRRVWTWSKSALPAGSHTVRWNGKTAAEASLSPGLYYARMATALGTRVTPLVRLK